MSDPKPKPGARLKAEREQRGLSAQKAADEMHLDAWVIDALEAGDYARIGPTVYAKGHLRKYASMLGLPVDEIMSDFEPRLPAAPGRDASSIPVGSRHAAPAQRVVSPAQAAACLAAAILLIGIMWWQPWHQRAPAPVVSVPNAGAPAASAAEVPEQATAADVEERDTAAAGPITAQDYAPAAAAVSAVAGAAVAGKTVAAAPGKTAAGAAGAAPSAGSTGAAQPPPSGQAPATPAAGRARLRLSFSSDSWVDVRDALGNRAYAGNGSANTVKTIAGNAPLHVYLRSANGVQLEINGRAVAIGPQFFSGDVARFEAGADGVLRRDTSHPEQSSARPPG
jgi:cytoskeleton protein RodZ